MQDICTLSAACLAVVGSRPQGGVRTVKLEIALQALASGFPIQNYSQLLRQSQQPPLTCGNFKNYEALGSNMQPSGLGPRDTVWLHMPCGPDKCSQHVSAALTQLSVASPSRCEDGLLTTHSHVHPAMPNTR